MGQLRTRFVPPVRTTSWQIPGIWQLVGGNYIKLGKPLENSMAFELHGSQSPSLYINARVSPSLDAQGTCMNKTIRSLDI